MKPLKKHYRDATTTRVREFFESNADEILTLEDARAKWGLTPRQLGRCLETLRLQGSIVTATCIMRAVPEVRND